MLKRILLIGVSILFLLSLSGYVAADEGDFVSELDFKYVEGEPLYGEQLHLEGEPFYLGETKTVELYVGYYNPYYNKTINLNTTMISGSSAITASINPTQLSFDASDNLASPPSTYPSGVDTYILSSRWGGYIPAKKVTLTLTAPQEIPSYWKEDWYEDNNFYYLGCASIQAWEVSSTQVATPPTPSEWYVGFGGYEYPVYALYVYPTTEPSGGFGVLLSLWWLWLLILILLLIAAYLIYRYLKRKARRKEKRKRRKP